MGKISQAAIEVDQLSFCLAGRPLLENSSFSVRFGRRTALIGRNGAGKTSLLKLLLGLSDLNEIRSNRDGSTSSGKIQIHSSRPKIGYLPQSTTLNFDFPISVRDFLQTSVSSQIRLVVPHNQSLAERCEDMLHRLELNAQAEQNLDTLSGGQLQKALFARILLQGSELIVLDEPFRSLDVPTTEFLLRVLEAEAARGAAILVVTHDLECVRTHFDETMILENKTVVSGQTPAVFASELFHTTFLHQGWCQDDHRRESVHV